MKNIILKTILIMSIIFAFQACEKEVFATIDNDDLKSMIEKKVQVIDIRRDEEFKKYGIIEGSHMLTFFDKKGKYNVEAWMKEFEKIVTSKDQEFVIYCAHANRTKVVAELLAKEFGYTNVNELKGGINYGWLDKGEKTVRAR